MWIWRNFQIHVSEQEHLFYGSLAKDKQMFGTCFRQFLFERYSWPTRTSFCLQHQWTSERRKLIICHRSSCTAFGTSYRKRIPRSLWCPRLLQPRATMNKKLSGNNTIYAWSCKNTKSLAENTSLFWDEKQEEFGGWRRYNISRKVPLPMNFLA